MGFVWRQSLYRSAAAVFLSALLSLGLIGCGSGGDLGPDPGIAPTITSQPASTTVDAGATASFSVVATGDGLSYQWQRNGTNIPAATLSVYTTPALAVADGGALYTVVIANASGSATSNAATLVVVQQPADASVVDGASATFSAAVGNGTPTTSHQWRRNGTAIDGATAATYTTPTNTLADTNTIYSVVITTAGGTVTSRDARLTVTARPPTMTTQPANASTQYLTGATFTAQASGTPPLAYQWYRNGVALSGETGTTLSVPGVNYGDDGARYAVGVTNAGGEITSQSGVLTVTPPPGTLQEISSCQDLGAAGAYRLTADLAPLTTAGATCITISASNVQLDCAVPNAPVPTRRSFGATGTNSRALRLGSGLQNISIKNCTIVTSRIAFDRVINVSVHDNEFPAGAGGTAIEADQASLLAIDNNTVVQGAFRQTNGRSVTVSNNRITAQPGDQSTTAGVVWSLFGTGTRVLSNTLVASWNSDRLTVPPRPNGAGNGIVIEDESDVVLAGNAITDIFACGVQFLGSLNGVTARDNRIVNAGQCGFYGATSFSMSSSRFVGNTIDRSAIAFHFFRSGGLRTGETAVVFRDITIERNTLSGAVPSDSNDARKPPVVILPIFTQMSSDVPPPSDPPASAFQLGNVRFSNNTFDTAAGGPMEFGQGAFTPGLIVDGGGNKCPRSAAAGFPIACGN